MENDDKLVQPFPVRISVNPGATNFPRTFCRDVASMNMHTDAECHFAASRRQMPEGAMTKIYGSPCNHLFVDQCSGRSAWNLPEQRLRL
jgi:hypothetical protein